MIRYLTRKNKELNAEVATLRAENEDMLHTLMFLLVTTEDATVGEVLSDLLYPQHDELEFEMESPEPGE
jgi:hypothetical protein